MRVKYALLCPDVSRQDTWFRGTLGQGEEPQNQRCLWGSAHVKVHEGEPEVHRLGGLNPQLQLIGCIPSSGTASVPPLRDPELGMRV